MAVACWLHKVFVILTFFGISGGHFDDLIDRIRQSKSNDPEVKDFLRTVMKHHDDFRWIQDYGATKLKRAHRYDQILPLRGLPVKAKRSFHASIDTSYPERTERKVYGYRYGHRSPIDYDRPINDIYPYDEEEEELRRPYGSNLHDADYDGHAISNRVDEDFLDDEEPDASKFRMRRREKRSLHIEGNQVPDVEDIADDEVGVAVMPDSEKGVLYAPGNKYELKSDDYKQKRECSDADEFGDAKKNETVETPLGEFYFSNPHDIIGLNQDMTNESRELNKTCSKYKKKVRRTRGIHLNDFLVRSKKNKDKGIKIKIYDDSRLVKDVKKGTSGNSIVLTLKGEGGASTRSALNDLYSTGSSLTSNNVVKDDDTLQKIDTILQHDEASLKLSAQLPTALKAKKENMELPKDFLTLSNEDLQRSEKVVRKSVKPAKNQENKKGSYERLNEKGTRVEKNEERSVWYKLPTNPDDKSNEDADTGSRMAKEDCVVKKVFNKPSSLSKGENIGYYDTGTNRIQNKLEDQTEPTSAAEQRELGKINNNFHKTTPITETVTSDRMIVIPLKKSVDETDEDFNEAEELAKVRKMKSKFRVKDTKDMIHVRGHPQIKKRTNLLLGAAESKIMENLRRDLQESLEDDWKEQLSKASITETSVTNGKDDDYDDLKDILENREPRSAGYYSRRLQSINIPDLLGMTNDEDYSEDKTDYEDEDFLKKRSNEDATDRPVGEKRLNLFMKNNEKRADCPKNGGGGNELDIIERTQAILVHITSPPATEGPVQGNSSDLSSTLTTSDQRGQFDDSEDPSSRLNDDNVKVTESHDDDKNQSIADETTKESVTSRVVPHQGTKLKNYVEVDEPGDVLNQIMNLVGYYKQHTLRGKHKQKKDESLSLELPLLDYEDPGFTHHAHKDKKAHPSAANVNKCKIKEGTDHLYPVKQSVDHELRFDSPKPVKEGYVDVETVAEAHEEDLRRMMRNEMQEATENPLNFTPDTYESFKTIIEHPHRKLSRKTGTDSDSAKERSKRELSEDDLELEALMAPLRRDHSNIRKIKNFYSDPYLYEYRKHRVPDVSSSTGASSSVSTLRSTTGKTETTDKCVTTPSSTINPICLIEDNHVKSHHKFKGKKHHYEEKEEKMKELGDDTYDMRYKNNECHKDESDQEIRLKERIRERLRSDKNNRQKEHEHMKTILNGHLLLEIMDQFSSKLKDNDRLYKRFGQSIGRQCAKEQVDIIDSFREDQSKKDIKHAQLMLHQVIVMLNKIVADQVHRRTCLILAPTLRNYLAKIASPSKAVGKTSQVDEGYPLPPIFNTTENRSGKFEDKQGDFLFTHGEPDSKDVFNEANVKKKIRLIKKLLHKYNLMSENCQVKVEPVKTYLLDHLMLLEKLLREEKMGDSVDKCTIEPNYLCHNGSTSAKPGMTGEAERVSSASPSSSSASSPSSAVASSESPTASPASTTIASTVANAVSGAEIKPALRSYSYGHPLFNDFSKRGKMLSEKYRRLVEAADNFRRKRQIEQRLARLFGGESNEEIKKIKRDDLEDLNNIAFESPIVYSLDK